MASLYEFKIAGFDYERRTKFGIIHGHPQDNRFFGSVAHSEIMKNPIGFNPFSD
jgi:hypothetical protein